MRLSQEEVGKPECVVDRQYPAQLLIAVR
jgi:hypothetical protein